MTELTTQFKYFLQHRGLLEAYIQEGGDLATPWRGMDKSDPLWVIASQEWSDYVGLLCEMRR